MSAFSGIEAFVHTAEQGSFRQAATRLEVSPAAVSKAIARLESRLGVRLLDRTTRRVAITPEGAAYLAHCRVALDALQAGEDQVSLVHEVAQGTVRVSLPPILGPPVAAALPRLLDPHPRLHLDLRLTDRRVDLHHEDVDVAVRIGPLDDSALVARRLATPSWVTVASPAYLARQGVPTRPADLAQGHACWMFTSPDGGTVTWRFADARGGPGVPIDLPVAHRVDQGEVLVGAAIAGVGIAQVFDVLAADALADGRLVEVLPNRAAQGPWMRALCRPGLQRAARVRVVLDLLVDVFASAPR